jgi:aspartate-semialdehyde dehydrogenase
VHWHRNGAMSLGVIASVTVIGNCTVIDNSTGHRNSLRILLIIVEKNNGFVFQKNITNSNCGRYYFCFIVATQ